MAKKQPLSGDHAGHFMTRRPTKLMIAIGGMSGSGKSTLGHALGCLLGNTAFLDADVLRKKMFGVEPLTPLPPDAYSPENTCKFIEFARSEAARHLKTHDVVIVTGLFIDEKTRGHQAAFAKTNDADFIGLYLDAPLSTLFNRVHARIGTPSDADLAVLKRQAKDILSRTRKRDGWCVINSGQSFEKVLYDAMEAIGKHRKKHKHHSPKKVRKP